MLHKTIPNYKTLDNIADIRRKDIAAELIIKSNFNSCSSKT